MRQPFIGGRPNSGPVGIEVKESKEGGTSEEAKHSSDVIRKKDIHAEREEAEEIVTVIGWPFSCASTSEVTVG